MQIKDILPLSQKRQLKLINYLIKNSPVSQKILITELSYSEPTLYRDISSLNLLISPVTIETNNKIKLIIPPSSNIRHIYCSLLLANTEFNLIEELFFCETHTIASLSDKLFTSNSSIRRIIKKLNATFKQHDIQISSYPLKLVGAEQKICSFLTHLFSEKYSEISHPFTSLQFEFLTNLMNHLSKYKNIDLSHRNLNHLKLLIIISIIRINHGNIEKHDSYYPSEIYTDFFDTQATKQLFIKAFGSPITNDGIQHLVYLINSTQLALNKQDLVQMSEKNPDINKKLVLFRKLIKNISSYASIQIEDEDTLIYRIYNTDTFYSHFSSIFYDKNKEFVDEMNLSNERFILYLKKELTQLNLSSEWSNNSIYPIAYTLITHWKNFSIYLRQNNPVAHVGLFFDSDRDHMSFVIDELKYYFNDTLIFQVIDLDELKHFEQKKEPFDFIITNIPKLLDNSDLFICISMYPSSNDIEVIQKKYHSLTR